MNWDDEPVQFESAAFISNAADRREGLEDYLHAKAQRYPEARYYLEHGRWMGSARAPNPGESHLRTGDNRCYYNAQTSLLPGYDYAEGYAVSRGGAIAHAWLLGDAEPIELSPSLLGMDVEYYGATFPDDLVRRVMADRGTAEPIVEAVA